MSKVLHAKVEVPVSVILVGPSGTFEFVFSWP